MSHYVWRRKAFPGDKYVKAMEKSRQEMLKYVWCTAMPWEEEAQRLENHKFYVAEFKRRANKETYVWSLQERLLIYFYGPFARIDFGEVTFRDGALILKVVPEGGPVKYEHLKERLFYPEKLFEPRYYPLKDGNGLLAILSHIYVECCSAKMEIKTMIEEEDQKGAVCCCRYCQEEQK